MISKNISPPVDMAELIKNLATPGAISHKFKQRFIVNIRNQWMPVAVKTLRCLQKKY